MRIMKLAHYTLLTLAGAVWFAAVPQNSFAQEAAPAEGEAAAPAISPVEQAAMDEEVAYVRALNQASLPDIAARVIVKAKQKFPLVAPRMEVLEQEGILALGKFDEVKALIAKKPKGSPEYWALNLAMADAYYSRNEMKECSAIYEAFFKAVPKPTPALQSFWLESAFKWAQMLLSNKREKDASKIYDAMLGTSLPETTWCLVASENAELLIRLAAEIPGDTKDANQKGFRDECLKKATAIVNKLLWKRELIIYFGRAVAMMAHVEVLKGNLAKAQDLVMDYMGDLSEIHNQLQEFDPDGSKGSLRLSPMPQCRYLLAEILYKEAMKAKEKAAKGDKEATETVASCILGAKKGAKRNGNGAYNHAINVYVKYPESPWAAKSGELVENCCDLVQELFGKDLRAATKIPPGQMKKVRDMQFKTAIAAYNSGEYLDNEKTGAKGAETLLLELLHTYPELDESVNAAVTLSELYGKLAAKATDPLDKQYYLLAEGAVAGYVADRFAGLKSEAAVKAAGEQVLRLAEQMKAAGKAATADKLYAAFFTNFSTHYLAAQTAYSMGASAYQKGDFAEAAKYYEMFAENFPKNSRHNEALKNIIGCYQKLSDVPGQVKAMKNLAADPATSPFDRITMNLAVANIQKQEGFERLNKILDAEAEGGEGSEEDKKAVAQNIVHAIQSFQGVVKDADEYLASTKDPEIGRAHV